ncbi:hypothetical protein RKD27_005250 [Streptomyces sp. SAI-126]|jgi:hypothetical protein|uniref:DUF397 domain-containing protein n=1 Tax=unclassified Streptomyces TaxID=2593676 RepID=UPI000F4D5913|nr:DUF397 domain-containing protein [Streptomyces sp. TUS-ST3]GLP71442.1 hypothetical protein TUSST3_80620 [Streptomyces sp. TUS-ST3]
MTTNTWRKSSYCQEGEACVHISAAPDGVHITDSDAARTVVTVSRAAFAALLKSL